MLPWSSTILAVMKERSSPLALILLRSATSIILAAEPAVVISLVNTTAPFFLETAFNVPASNGTLQNT
ncbi:hypothetical protein D3C80_1820160 [compost metagenome]